MDKNVKQIKPMLCPVCGKFYFSKLDDVHIEQLGMTPNSVQCTRCGWFYDLEQTKDPDLENQSQYYLDFVGEPEPHKCPVCGEYTFKDSLPSDICPVCGWEDTGFEDVPDEKPSPYMMSFNEKKAWFEEQRKKDPKFRWYVPEKKKK